MPDRTPRAAGAEQPAESLTGEELAEAVNRLADEYRTQCLWFLREDYYPTDDEQRRRVLDYIAGHGDLRAFQRDRRLLEAHGCTVVVGREWASFVGAEVTRGEQSIAMEWSRDSAYRFFPLVEHPDFGLVPHPFDLATNKVLALVGRLEVRDWIDVR